MTTDQIVNIIEEYSEDSNPILIDSLWEYLFKDWPNDPTEGNKSYRLSTNPEEENFLKTFKDTICRDGFFDLLVFSSLDCYGDIASDRMNYREIKQMYSLIQWLGSPVGMSFLNKCGWYKEKDK